MMNKRLKKDSPIPLYKQIKNKILEEIKLKSQKGNLKICSEREYAKIFNVSRITVQLAIKELVNENYLIRVVGKGTFITDYTKSSELYSVVSFTDDMQSRGHNVSSKVLEFKITEANEDLAQMLKINVNDKIFKLNRIRFSNNIPMAIQTDYIIYNMCQNLSDYDFNKVSLFRIMYDRYNLQPSHSKITLGARFATKEEIDIFNLKELIPVFILDQIIYLENEKPIEFGKSIYRCDKYKFFTIAPIKIKNNI